MAVKKIKLDFSKVEERSGWNTRGIPEGLHKMKVESVQETEAQDGTDMLVYSLVPADKKYKSRNFPFYCKLQQNQLWKLRDLIVATGGTVPKKLGMVDPNGPVGKYIAAEVEDETGAYEGRSSVNGTYGLDILDGDDDASDDDDDEEYEGDEDAEDEGDDEDEEAEDDEEDDLSELSLPELRKLAKELGIVTVGLKKDDLITAIEEEQEAEDEDEDDDLDDEDLEDEDLEDEEFEDDEEEEEAPAPRRKAAAKAPARKPTAKAPAAPARRVVKRR